MTSSAAVAPLIRLVDVTVEFRAVPEPVRALDAVSLVVESTSSIAVVGRSGSGKSSLVSVMGLMRRPTAGRVEVDGRTVGRRGCDRGWVAMVYQSFHLEPHLTAAENAMLPWYCGRRETSVRGARRRAGEVIDLVGLHDMADRRVSQMSGGERQRVAVARALFARPRLLIADEPTGNLDEETAAEIAGLLWDLPRQTGAAVLVVTHDATVAKGASDVIVLERGRVRHATEAHHDVRAGTS